MVVASLCVLMRSEAWYRSVRLEITQDSDALSPPNPMVPISLGKPYRIGPPDLAYWIEEEVGWRTKEEDRALYDQIADCQSKCHYGFCDNFNTPDVIDALSSLVTFCNIYIARPPPAAPAVYLLQKAAVYVTQILKVVGVAEGSDEIGFPVSSGGSESEVEGPLDALTEFRHLAD